MYVCIIHAYICIYIHARTHTHTHTLGDLRGREAFLEQLGQREVANVAICKVHGHRTPLAHGYSLHLAFEVRELEQALFCGRLHKRRVLCVRARARVRVRILFMCKYTSTSCTVHGICMCANETNTLCVTYLAPLPQPQGVKQLPVKEESAFLHHRPH